MEEIRSPTTLYTKYYKKGEIIIKLKNNIENPSIIYEGQILKMI